MLDSTPVFVGPCRLLRRLGEGASGTVWLAEQLEPRRAVAIRLLDAPQGSMRARFAGEAQRLARLEHPGIARLYATGEDAGPQAQRLWLAMEYLPGPTLLQHAAGKPLRERIALLANVCRAVHHAHTRGVIHRDLKPASIRVDAYGVPKLLDFGIAQLVAPEDDEVQAGHDERPGTLPYRSWEQIGGGAAASDPRSDVFSLAVIGYELACGERPYGAPSGPGLAAVLEQRRESQPLPLGRRVAEARGDLETILHKAFAFDPEDRYDSAADLAGELQRWLEHRPIEARPLTPAYAIARFARRHAGYSIAAGLLVASLAVAALVSTRQALAEQAALARAEQRGEQLLAVNRLLEDTLAGASPDASSDAAPESPAPASARTLREVLEHGERALLQDRSLPPAVAAQVLKAIGSAWLDLEQPARAARTLQLAREQLARIATPDEGQRLLALELRALAALAQLAAGEVEPGSEELRAVLAALPPGPRGAAQQLRLLVQGRHADALLGRAAYDEAIVMLGPVLRESTATLGADHLQTLSNASRLARARRLAGQPQLALAELATLLPRLQRVLGPEHRLTRQMQGEQGLCWLAIDRPAEAEAAFRALLEIDTRLSGESGPGALAARGQLVDALMPQQRWAEATELAARNHQLAIDRFGADHHEAHSAARRHARVLEQAGRPAEAEPLYRAAIAGIPKQLGPRHPEAFRARNDYGLFLIGQQRAPEAVALYAAMHAQAVATFGEDDANTVAWDGNWGRALHAAGRMRETAVLLRRVLPLLERHYGPDSGDAVTARARLAEAEAALGGDAPRAGSGAAHRAGA